ncbi:unnamed protein product, partial [Callosobruchus maculatus]
MESYTCDHCNNTYSSRWNLKRHQASSCDGSGESSSKRARLRLPTPKGRPIANHDSSHPRGMQSTVRPGMQCTTQAGLSHQVLPGPSGVQCTTQPGTSRQVLPGPSDVQCTTEADPSDMQSTTGDINAKYCPSCARDIPTKMFSAHLRSLKHKAHSWKPVDASVSMNRSAFGGKIVSYQVVSDLKTLNVEEYLHSIKLKTINLLEQQIFKHTSVKANVELFGIYILPTKEKRDVKSHSTANKVFTIASDLSKDYDDFVTKISVKSKEFAERESGWVLEQILYLEINISKYNPLRASSYIPLPKVIASKKAVVNICNTDNCCFAWSIVAALFSPQGRVTDTKSYPHYSSI